MADQSQAQGPLGSTTATGERAGFGSRLGAAFLDGLLVSLVVNFIGLAFGKDFFTYTRTDNSFELHFGATGPYALVVLAVPVLYYAILEGGQAGQTLGKKIMNIRVADFNGGGPIGFGRGLLRYIGRFASAAVCALGYFWMLWDKEKQTWHDKIATAVVVKTS